MHRKRSNSNVKVIRETPARHVPDLMPYLGSFNAALRWLLHQRSIIGILVADVTHENLCIRIPALEVASGKKK